MEGSTREYQDSPHLAEGPKILYRVGDCIVYTSSYCYFASMGTLLELHVDDWRNQEARHGDSIRKVHSCPIQIGNLHRDNFISRLSADPLPVVVTSTLMPPQMMEPGQYGT